MANGPTTSPAERLRGDAQVAAALAAEARRAAAQPSADVGELLALATQWFGALAADAETLGDAAIASRAHASHARVRDLGALNETDRGELLAWLDAAAGEVAALLTTLGSAPSTHATPPGPMIVPPSEPLAEEPPAIVADAIDAQANDTATIPGDATPVPSATTVDTSAPDAADAALAHEPAGTPAPAPALAAEPPAMAGDAAIVESPRDEADPSTEPISNAADVDTASAAASSSAADDGVPVIVAGAFSLLPEPMTSSGPQEPAEDSVTTPLAVAAMDDAAAFSDAAASAPIDTAPASPPPHDDGPLAAADTSVAANPVTDAFDSASDAPVADLASASSPAPGGDDLPSDADATTAVAEMATIAAEPTKTAVPPATDGGNEFAAPEADAASIDTVMPSAEVEATLPAVEAHADEVSVADVSVPSDAASLSDAPSVPDAAALIEPPTDAAAEPAAADMAVPNEAIATDPAATPADAVVDAATAPTTSVEDATFAEPSPPQHVAAIEPEPLTPEPAPASATPEPLADAAPAPDAPPMDAIAAPPDAGPMELTPEQMAALMAGDGASAPSAPDAGAGWGSTMLELPPDKLELLQFMVADAKASLDQFESIASQLESVAGREEGATALGELAGTMRKICDFFGFPTIARLTELLSTIAEGITLVPEALIAELMIRVRGIQNLLEQHIRGLECRLDMTWPLDTLAERISILLAGRALHPMIVGWHQGDRERLLELDLVTDAINDPPKPPSSAAPEGAPAAGADARAAAAPKPGADAGPATVRVPAAALERLVEEIGQLVLTKNRVHSLTRGLRSPADRDRCAEELSSAADELARLCAGIQLTVMGVRTQPLAKLFERYPRVVRDIAALAEKEVEVRTGGEDAHVDKTVFDGVGEPLAQLLRTVVSRFVEAPAAREATGKPRSATISVDADNLGNRVRVTVRHDGATPAASELLPELPDLTDQAALERFLGPESPDPQAAAAARTFADMKALVSATGSREGGQIEILIPLSAAVVPAILVSAAGETYAIPLQNVEEIIHLGSEALKSIRGEPVLRLRERVLPVLDVASIVGAPSPAESSRGAGVVVRSGNDAAVLRVDRIVGKQEVVIKALSPEVGRGEHIAGATIGDDGRVRLVLQPDLIIRRACTSRGVTTP